MKNLPVGLTFDDVLLIPQKSEIHHADINLATRLTGRVSLSLPIISAVMDTVTEAAMAAAMAKEGGAGIIHRNCSIEQQVRMVRQAKKSAKNALVGAGIGPGDLDRAKALDKAGADIISIDCAHAHKQFIIDNAKKLKKSLKAELIIGNIATAEAAKAFLPYADALKVGVGPGSICTTRVISGVGVPQLTAIMDVAKIAKTKNIPVIADGGIRYSGDIVKALAAGADAVMLGSLLAGAKEAPGKIITIQGVKYKAYRGMGSAGAMKRGSADRYGQNKKAAVFIPEGVEGLTPYVGTVQDILFQLAGGIKSGMGYIGAKNMKELQRRAKFIRITEAGKHESHPHSLSVIKNAANYTLPNS